jgi:uncharacterized protein (TIGR01244 family)
MVWKSGPLSCSLTKNTGFEMNKLSILIGLAVFMTASAEEVNPDAMPTVHVDVAEVAASGAVAAVDGITSAGQPDAEALKVFADAGYVAVIDMRGPDEDRGMDDEPAVVEGLGLEYVAFPLASGDEISFAAARKLDQMLETYDGPVLLHCGSGNRVGAILALRESLNGADDEAAIAFGKTAGLTRLEDLVRDRLTKEKE